MFKVETNCVFQTRDIWKAKIAKAGSCVPSLVVFTEKALDNFKTVFVLNLNQLKSINQLIMFLIITEKIPQTEHYVIHVFNANMYTKNSCFF